MYKLDIKPTADKAFKKLAKKDKEQLRRVNAKIQEILEDPYRFKPMRFPLDGCRRVHVGSFVILYEIDESKSTVTILDYDHHDNIYDK
jgi:YafQ family addiction module toxin component